MAIQTSRGERNNNPFNIRHSASKWQGMAPTQPDSAFVAFTSPVLGIRAGCVTLLTYQEKYSLKTVRQIITRWAPPGENKTDSYMDTVAQGLGVQPDDALDLRDEDTLAGLACAMIGVECGRMPYDQGTVMQGVRAALAIKDTGLIKQASAAPTRKVSASVAGGLAGMPAAWMVKALWDHLMPEAPIPDDMAVMVGSALSTGLAFVFAYFTHERAA